jgi:hypothetical protein
MDYCPNLAKPPRTHAPPVQKRRSSSVAQAEPAVSRSSFAGRTTKAAINRGKGVRSTRAPARRETSATGSASVRTGPPRLRFRVRFQAERVFEATDVRDALRQAETLGATEITAVARED